MLDTRAKCFHCHCWGGVLPFFYGGGEPLLAGGEASAHNDLIGWQLSVLGTTYAVIVGFMLYTVWINFGAADLNADAEANSLVNVYRLSYGLARGTRGKPQRTGAGIWRRGRRP